MFGSWVNPDRQKISFKIPFLSYSYRNQDRQKKKNTLGNDFSPFQIFLYTRSKKGNLTYTHVPTNSKAEMTRSQ